MYRILLIILICILSSDGFAQSNQEKEDSLLSIIETTQIDTIKIQHYQSLAELFIFQQPEIGIKYARKVLSESKKAKYHKGAIHAYMYIISGHNSLGSPGDSALAYIKLMSMYIKSNNTQSYLYSIGFYYSSFYDRIGQSDRALESSLESLKNIEKHNSSNTTLKAKLLTNIGYILHKQKKFDQALYYYGQALELSHNSNAKSNLLYNIAIIHIESLNLVDTGFILLEEAKIAYEANNDKSGICAILLAKANYYQKIKKYERVEQLYQEALQISQQSNLGSFSLRILKDIAKYNFKIKKYNSAIRIGNQALEGIKNQQVMLYLDDVYHILHKSYAAVGNYPKAYEMMDSLLIVKDSLSNTTLLTKVEELQTKYKVTQREIENSLLKSEKAVADEKVKSRTAISVGILSALLLLAIWSFHIYRSNQQRKTLNKQLESTVYERTIELQTANKSLQQANYELRTFNYIASHDIKEPIRNVGNYAGLIFRKLPDNLKTSLGSYFETIKKSTNQLYTLVEDFARYTTMSKDQQIEKQSVSLNSLTESLEYALNESIQKYNGRIINNGLPIIESSSSLLYTVFKNLIENGLKYNKSIVPTVDLSYISTETHHQIIFSDNGIGIKEEYHEKIFEMFKRLHNRGEYEGSGIGLAIVKLCIDKVGGEIMLESEINKGSRFILSLPK